MAAVAGALSVDGHRPRLLVGVIGARSQLFAKLPEMDSRRPIAGILFVAAVISGVGLLLIRFTSDQAWWTGHLRDGL